MGLKRRAAGTGIAAVVSVAWMFVPAVLAAGSSEANPYNDPPPRQATHGIPGCKPPVVPVLTPEQARAQAHSRIERGTSCALAGTCEPGGAYKHDAEITEQVARIIASDPRFDSTSVWVETLRRFVTLKGCLSTPHQGAALEALVKTVKGVDLVWQEAVPQPLR